MTSWFLLILVFFCGSCSGETLWAAIQASTANISDFRKLVIDTETSSFIDFQVLTVFIPTDAAYAKLYPSGVHALPRETKKLLVKSHLAILKDIINGRDVIAKTSIFDLPESSGIIKRGRTDFGVGQYIELKSLNPEVPMYMVRSRNTTSSGYDYFINNAELMPPNIDQEAGKGAFQVVNEVIYPFGSIDSVYSYLEKNNTFSEYLQYISLLSDSEPRAFQLKKTFTQASGSKSSFFVPTNTALNLPESVKKSIKENSTHLLEFLMSHVAEGQIIFSSWMQYRPMVHIQTMLTASGLATKPLNSTIYLTTGSKVFVSVGGVTAQVIGSTQPLANGVLIAINQPLNLLYRSVRTILQTNAPGFLTACDANVECKKYVDGGKGVCTIFAPRSFPSDLLTNPMLNDILMLHIFPERRLTLATMPTGSVEYSTANDTGKLRFHVSPEENRVAARMNTLVRNVYSQGFVGSAITEADVAGTDGVVQVLATYIGYPTRSIYQVLEEHYSVFSRLIGYLDNLDINLKTLNEKQQHYTFFAPTNKALEMMEAGSGKQILDNMADRNALFKRLLLLNTVLLSNLTLNTQYVAVTALAYSDVPYEHTEMKIMVTTNREKDVEASINIGATNTYSVVKPYNSEWGATNGIVYALDTVPYDSTLVARVCKSGTTCKGAASFRVSWTWSVLFLFVGQVILRTF